LLLRRSCVRRRRPDRRLFQIDRTAALSSLLLETLERLDNDDVGSEGTVAALRDTCDRAREELANVRAEEG
jgi:hypothetical protein